VNVSVTAVVIDCLFFKVSMFTFWCITNCFFVYCSWDEI